MDIPAFDDLFRKLETDNILAYLEGLDLNAIMHNPWLLGGLSALALLALVMRWRLLLVTLLAVTGLAGITIHTLQQGTDIDNVLSQNLLTFVGVSVAIIFIAIYLLFINND